MYEFSNKTVHTCRVFYFIQLYKKELCQPAYMNVKNRMKKYDNV